MSTETEDMNISDPVPCMRKGFDIPSSIVIQVWSLCKGATSGILKP